MRSWVFVFRKRKKSRYFSTRLFASNLRKGGSARIFVRFPCVYSPNYDKIVKYTQKVRF